MRLVSCLAVHCNPSRINTGSRRHLGSWAGFINCVEKTRRSSMESQSDVPLLLKLPRPPPEKKGGGKIQFQGRLAREVWEESKKLGEVVGPAVFMNLVFSSMNLVSQSFAGHLGDLDLAAFSIANTVVDGFNFAMLLGMASATETLCGQAYGAKQYHMLGIYLQRSWLVLLAFAALLAPVYVFSGQLLAAFGQPAELSRAAGSVSMYFLPSHFMYAIHLPVMTFLQCQRKNWVPAVATAVVFAVHVAATWLLVNYLGLGIFGVAMAFNLSWVVLAALLLSYALGGGCPETWSGFSASAFVDLKEFVTLSASSGVMVCLENWYYRILIFLTAYMKSAELAVDALSICMSLTGWEMMIHMGFLEGTGVRVANELGAANGNGARFATIVSTAISFLISLFASFLALIFHNKLAVIFSSSGAVIDAVDNISVLLALTILLNGIQPVLSGVAIGSGWQALVAYVNVGSYYLIGVPLGVLLGWCFNYGVPVCICTTTKYIVENNMGFSGGATGYAGYAPAYPAIPATKQVYIRIYTYTLICCIPRAKPEHARLLARAASERQARERASGPCGNAAHAASNGDGITGQCQRRYGITDRGSASVGLRVFVLPYVDAQRPTPIQIVHAVGCRPRPVIVQSSTRPCDLVSCPVRPSPCPMTAPAGHRHLGEFVIRIVLLHNYIDDMRQDDSFKGLDNIVDLSVKLVETKRHKVHDMVYELLKLVLLLPVATASVERVFSAMVFMKTKLRNKMGDSLLDDYLVTFIERDIFFEVDEDDIIKTFMSLQKRRIK